MGPPLPEPDFHLAYYVVLVIDVLGQRLRLRELRDLLQSADEFQKAVEPLRDTAGFPMVLRQGFKDYFSAWGTSSDFFQQVPAHIKDSVVRAYSSEITYRPFSDSIIVSVCLSYDVSKRFSAFFRSPLGEEVSKRYAVVPELIRVLPKAYRFVRDVQLRWHSQHDPRLAARYDNLWRYFRSRAHV
jgi:hypothetical protein